jgi:hypothetical protein
MRIRLWAIRVLTAAVASSVWGLVFSFVNGIAIDLSKRALSAPHRRRFSVEFYDLTQAM